MKNHVNNRAGTTGTNFLGNQILLPAKISANNSILIILLAMLSLRGTITAGNPPNFGDFNCPCFEGHEIGDPQNQSSVTYLTQSSLASEPDNDPFNNCVVIHGKLIINTNFTFDGWAIVMDAGAEIEIPGSRRLTIKNGTAIFGCEYMWRSITVKAGGELDMEDSFARNAQFAVRAESLSKIRLVGNTFDANYVGFFVPPSVSPSIQNVVYKLNGSINDFKDNQFVNQSTYLPGGFITQPLAGVWVNNMNAFSIGHPSNGSVKNYFENLEIGIIDSKSSNNHFSGCEITNLNSGANTYLGFQIEQNAVYVSIHDCAMTNLGYGISFINPAGFKVENNSIEHWWRGVLISKGGKGNGLIKGNGITTLALSTPSSAQICIELGNCTIGSNYSLDIKGNTLTVQGTGINVYTTKGKLNIVEDNTINLAHSNPNPVSHGIIILNTSGPTNIKGNTLDLMSGAYSNIGIGLGKTENTHVSENKVLGTIDFGIQSSFSPNNLFCCNSLSGPYHAGVIFFGHCNDTQLKNTIFGSHYAALYLADAQISPQVNYGNDWTGASTVWDAYFQGNSFDIPNSVFYTDPALMPNGYSKIHVPLGAIPQDWFTFTGEDPTCQEWQNCGVPPFNLVDNPDEFNTLTAFDLDALVPNQGSDPVQKVLKWEAQRYLYKKLVNNPSLVYWNNDVATFFNDAQNGLIGQFHTVESSIRNLGVPPDSLSEEYYGILSSLDEIGEELATIEVQLLTANETEKATLLAQQENLRSQTGSLLSDLIDLEEQLQTWKNSRISQLITFNSAITAEATYQAAELEMYGIYLQTIAQDTLSFTQAQRSSIEVLAFKCPTTDGTGVFWARSLRQYYAPGWDWRAEACLEIEERSSEMKDETGLKTENLQIFPNPANGQFTLRLTKPLESEGQLQVYDLNGILLADKKLTAGTVGGRMDIGNLRPGIYVCKIMEAGNLLSTIRIAVIN